MTSRNLHGDKVDQPLGRIDGSTAYWPLSDHLGSVRKVIDNTGAVKDAIVYDAFGNIVSETDSSKRGMYSWTGREIDVETGLQYNRARYYDPVTARWISQDPMGFDAGDSNLYRYAQNRPAEYSDPSGLQRFRLPLPPKGRGIQPGLKKAPGIAPAPAKQLPKGGILPAPAPVLVPAPVPAPRAADPGPPPDRKAVQNESNATIYRYPPQAAFPRIPHFSIDVRFGRIAMHTNQVITANDMSSTQIVLTTPAGSDTNVTVALPNAAGAIAHQTVLLASGNLGAYNLFTNSCATHVVDVVRAGGVPVPGNSNSYVNRLFNN